MLKSEKGAVTVKGSAKETLFDLALLIRCVYESYEDSFGEEIAKKAIADAGRIAFDETFDEHVEEVK